MLLDGVDGSFQYYPAPVFGLPPGSVPSWVSELTQAIANTPEATLNGISDLLNSPATQTVGQGVEILGGILSEAPGPNARRAGDLLQWLGKGMQDGHLLNDLTAELAVEYGFEAAGDAAAAAALLGLAGFFLPIAIAALPGAAPIITLFALQQLGWWGGVVGFIAADIFLGIVVGDKIADAASALAQGISSGLNFILHDPLVLDLNGDGIHTIALADSNAHFDYGRDGFAEKTGWVSSGDGILVIDSNLNGTVDGAGELFGSPSQDGFEVLETLDSNGDGKIDDSDAAFSKLRVWIDANGDGISQAGELKTLADVNVQSISLTRTDLPGTDNGNGLGFGSSFTRTDGTTGSAQTLYFATSPHETLPCWRPARESLAQDMPIQHRPASRPHPASINYRRCRGQGNWSASPTRSRRMHSSKPITAAVFICNNSSS